MRVAKGHLGPGELPPCRQLITALGSSSTSPPSGYNKLSMAKPIVIVGAGLAGLVCARKLHRSGKEVIVLDSEDRPGGRMKTDLIDGFRLDRGFQTLFTAYPHAVQELDYSTLNLRKFERGALVWDGDGLHKVSRDDPLEMAFSRFLRLSDKLKIFSYTNEVKSLSLDDIWHLEDISGEAALRQFGFSEEFLDRFARPFFGGIFLDRSLSVSARMLAFVWKMLSEGDTAIPALGIEQIPQQIALDLPQASLKMGTRVESILRENGAAVGVQLVKGKKIDAEAIVVATDGSTAARLTGESLKEDYRGSICLYFEAPVRPVFGGYIVLNGSGSGQVNHVAPMMNVAPELAPPGRGLVSVTILGESPKDDGFLGREALYELGYWFPKRQVQDWRLLRVDRIRHAQLSMAPRRKRLAMESGASGLYVCGEATSHGSIDGAIESGLACAACLVESPELVTA